MDGQATAPEMLDIDGLADFLDDNPEQEPSLEEESTQDEIEESSDDQPEESEEESDSEEEEKDPEPTTDRTFKVKVQGEDGAEIEKEVSEKELIDGFMMRSDYTRKTQELSEKEKTVTAQLAQKYEENRNHYLQEAQLARAAVVQLAGLKTQAEMAQLAQNDPAEWVAENQRQQSIASLITSLNERIQAEQAQVSEQQAQRLRGAYEHAWTELKKDGIDRDALAGIYKEASKTWGIPESLFSGLYDPGAVRLMRDAIAMKKELAELKEKAKTVKTQAQSAGKLPSKQAPATNERKEKALEAKFRSGTARLNDLAAWLS